MPTQTQMIMIGIVSVISAFGGFVQWIRKDDSIRTRTELVKTVSTGVFTGVLAFVALTTIEIDIMLRYVLAGLASYIGGSLLDMSAHVATKIVERKVGLDNSGENAEHLDQIAHVVQGYNKPSQAPSSPAVPVSNIQEVPASTTSSQPTKPSPASSSAQIRPGEISLAEYEAELLKEQAVKDKTESVPPIEQPVPGQPAPEVKPKRKRSPRKKTPL